MKAAIYCRVDGGGSPEMRRDALEMQKQELERYAVRKRMHLNTSQFAFIVKEKGKFVNHC